MIAPIPTPRHLLGQAVTVAYGGEAIDSLGTATQSLTSTLTVMGSLQPASASESMQYGRDTSTQVFVLYLDVNTTAGAAISLTPSQWKSARMTTGGQTYRAVGPAANLVSNGCLYAVTVEQDA